MNRNKNAQSKNLPVYGNILDSFMKLSELIPANDGTRSFTISSSEAYDKPLPITGENTETTINVTHQQHFISQIQDSFIIVDSAVQIAIPELTANAFGGASPVIFIGFKSANQVFRQMKILLNGVPTQYLSTECIREGFAFSNIKGASEKRSKKHTHTLYEDVEQYKLGVCGAYLPLSNWKNAQKTATVNIRCIVPLSDLLPLQAFSLYPSNIVGQLALKAMFSMRGLIWCQVDPSAVLESNNFLNNQSTPLSAKFGATAFYDRFFHQIGDSGYVTDENGTASYISSQVRPYIISFSVNRVSSQMMGYGVKQQTADAIYNFLRENQIFIPAQELQFVSYSVQPTAYGLTASTPILFDNVEAISVMFPTSQNQLTVFKNPNIANFQLKIDNMLLPPVPISTNSEVSPEFLTYQLNASDLDGSLEPTRSWIYSITNQRTNPSGVRYINTRVDDTDFMATFSLERSQGGNVFDGYSTTSSINVETRFTPLINGANDVYYIPDPASPTVHPPAPELWLCRDTFWIMSAGKLEYIKSGSPR